jgi:hypothetical protein
LDEIEAVRDQVDPEKPEAAETGDRIAREWDIQEVHPVQVGLV